LIIGVVDLDIKLVAHINSGSYRGEVETHRKRETFNTWHNAMRIQYDGMRRLMVLNLNPKTRIAS
jgi:hypothetical protein